MLKPNPVPTQRTPPRRQKREGMKQILRAVAQMEVGLDTALPLVDIREVAMVKTDTEVQPELLLRRLLLPDTAQEDMVV